MLNRQDELLRILMNKKLADSQGNNTIGKINNIKNNVGAVQEAISQAAPLLNGASVGASVGAEAGAGASGAMMSNPIGAIVALGAMALDGANRKRAKESGEQTQQLADAQLQNAKDRLNQSIADTVASQNQEPVAASDNNIINQAINDYANNQVKLAPVPTTETPTNNTNTILNNLPNGLNDFIKGYEENRNNGFKVENLQSNPDKSVMERIGEGTGTIARVAQNPIVQGVVAGGLSGLFSGDPLYGLTSAYKVANAGYKGNLYRDILKQQGIDVGNNRGNFDASDLAKILISKKYQKDYMTRGEYDRLRLDNGEISIDDYNQFISDPNYNPEEMINIGALGTIAKARKLASDVETQNIDNKYKIQNEGKNVMRVEYGEKPDSHSYTHVTYGEKPDSHNYTHVIYGNKPDSHNYTHVIYGQKPTQTNVTKPTQPNNKNPKSNDISRVKVKSPEGKIGTIPVSQLYEALKKGFKKINDN